MSRSRKTYYELARSQVNTPPDVVKTFWSVVRRYRNRLSSVLDLGAGDGRFAAGGIFSRYVGVEIDSAKTPRPDMPVNASIQTGCAFQFSGAGFSACIGNPPYVRHHDLETAWRDGVAKALSDQSGYEINRKCNLYVYFLFLSLFKTSRNGLVAAIVPYEWLSRPSAASLRAFIGEKKWQVDAYRFSFPVFPGVETTASISVIDKRQTNGRWRYFILDNEGAVTKAPSPQSSEDRLEFRPFSPRRL